MKIAVYAISKNEEKFVKRFCDSVKDADLIVIADTGSTDQTTTLALECGAVVHNIYINPWRFDKARDAALALLPSDIDVCVSLDLDEVMLPGWREEVERMWVGNINRLQYMYNNGDGLIFPLSKIHARNGFSWKYPCHEYIVPDKRIQEQLAVTPKMLVLHQADKTKSRGQYLAMLEMAVKEDPNCERSQFYYARELLFYGKYQECQEAFKKFLAMPTATWYVERAYALRVIGSIEGMLNKDGTAWFYKSAAEDPMAREPWMELANRCYQLQDWNGCYVNAKQALRITQQELWHTSDANVWGFAPHDFVAIAAHKLGLKEEAIKHGEIAVQFEPTNERLKQNLEFYRN